MREDRRHAPVTQERDQQRERLRGDEATTETRLRAVPEEGMSGVREGEPARRTKDLGIGKEPRVVVYA
jgi:hypothetical protein